MPIGTNFYLTLVGPDGRTTGLTYSPVTLDTGIGDATLSQGDVFTGSLGGLAFPFTYQGLALAPAKVGGLASGFTAIGAGQTYIFSDKDPQDAVVVAKTPGDFLVCFLAGSLIATPKGEVAVERLAIGDLVLTADGRAVPVLWLGQQTVSSLFGLTQDRQPVRIAAGALGDGLPRRDLCVTAGHALFMDGVLVNASALVNGSSITRMSPADLGERFTVYHIETERHEIVLAEGVATETFIDNVTRAHFDNFAEFVALHGEEDRPMAELDHPRAMSARQVPPAIRTAIAGRTAVLAAGTRTAA